ncbi:MAG TPA: TIGR03118 family protein [Tepidisphaeraceae bacterium]|nr:TIGR03118 family protein [Tepidisphaeraceae bacterium]
MKHIYPYRIIAALVLLLDLSVRADGDNVYVQTNLVASNDSYGAQIVDHTIIDAWGIALRPPGAGGHIWFSNAMAGTSTEYIGDVNGIPLHQDGLKTVTINTGQFADRGVAFVTGQAYNAASDFSNQADEFIVSGAAHDLSTSPPVPIGNTSGPAKFVFVTEDGTINAWRSNTAAAMDIAPVMIDYSKTATFPYAANSVFSGVALTSHAVPLAQQNNPQAGNHLFATDFRNNAIEVIDNQWHDVTATYSFQTPASVGDLHPFNIMDLGGHLFVTYAKWNPDGDEGFEDLPGYGHLVEYNEDGSLLKDFNDGGQLNSPWGMAIAPDTFGAFANDVLVANFGDGTIAAFDPASGNFLDQLRDTDGQPISIDGLWGLTFGNGVSLGDANALYFTAGPNFEQEGLFGRINGVPEPSSLAVMGLVITLFTKRGYSPSRAR